MARLTDVQLKNEAKEYFAKMGWVDVRLYHTAIEISRSKVPKARQKYKGKVPDISEGLENIVHLALGKTENKNFIRKLYILTQEIQDYGPLDELVSVGCIGTPAPELTEIRNKIHCLLKLQNATDGYDEDDNLVAQTIDPRITKLTWVLNMGECQDHPGTADDDVNPRYWLLGFYGLQVCISHKILDGETLFERTDSTIYGFRFLRRKSVSRALDWRKRIIDAGVSSRVLSISTSVVGRTLEEWLEEHSHSSVRQKRLEDTYETNFKASEMSNSRETGLSRSNSAATHGSERTRLARRSNEKQRQQEEIAHPGKKPRWKHTGFRQAFRAARERRSFYGSMDSSDVWHPSEKLTLDSLLSGVTGLSGTANDAPENSTGTDTTGGPAGG